MESLNKHHLLEFRPNTLEDVRRLFNLEQPGKMKDAIRIIQEWVKKQDHFTQKEFDEQYLESMIIVNKGLLERVKRRLDKICTLRTLMPDFFRSYIVKDFENMDVLIDAILPKTTSDYYRVYLFKNVGKKFTSTQFLNYYKRLIILLQYVLKHDYSAGGILIFDFSDANLLEVIKQFNVTDFVQSYTLVTEGLGYRIKGIHLLTQSKIVNTFVGLIKPLINPKLADRIQVHNDVNSLEKYVPAEILPKDYGGNEKPLMELHHEWINNLSSEEHIQYMEKINKARTDESKRKVDKFNENYLGMPGTFRTMNVD